MRAVRMLDPSASTPLTAKLRAPNPKALLKDGRSFDSASAAIGSAGLEQQVTRPIGGPVYGASGISHHCGPGGDIPRHHGAGTHHGLLADSQPAQDHGTRPERGTTLHDGPSKLPVAVVEKSPPPRGRPGQVVVDEDDAVADERSVTKRDAIADECVALDLAVGPDRGAPLDLYERDDPSSGADPAAVQIGERLHDDVIPEDHLVDEPIRGIVRGGRRRSTIVAPRGRARHQSAKEPRHSSHLDERIAPVRACARWP